jgi:hypothetical protein
MVGPFLLGYAPLLQEARQKVAVKAREEIKKAEPAEERARAKELTARTKVETKKAKLDAALRTAAKVEAERPNGRPAMLQAASDDVALRFAELNAALIELQSEDDELAVQANLLETWRSNLDEAAVALQAAYAPWKEFATSTSAKAVATAIEVLIATARAMTTQIENGPATAGDDLAVHINLLTVWESRLTEATVAYSAARAAWVPSGAVASAAADAAAFMQVTITGLRNQLTDYIATAQSAQAIFTRADNALEAYAGAKEALESLEGPTASTRGAIVKATSEREAQIRQAEKVKQDLATAELLQALRRRRGG